MGLCAAPDAKSAASKTLRMAKTGSCTAPRLSRQALRRGLPRRATETSPDAATVTKCATGVPLCADGLCQTEDGEVQTRNGTLHRGDGIVANARRRASFSKRKRSFTRRKRSFAVAGRFVGVAACFMGVAGRFRYASACFMCATARFKWTFQNDQTRLLRWRKASLLGKARFGCARVRVWLLAGSAEHREPGALDGFASLVTFLDEAAEHGVPGSVDRALHSVGEHLVVDRAPDGVAG